ncbi:glutamate--cysteine ligase [Pseudoalteromonas xiamenensis]|uniref:glutamate--cysteine ligase n=1 Tax=Pseudoalteromonas xiamenensis TaxID=882626 RepID=UPI0035EA3EB0
MTTLTLSDALNALSQPEFVGALSGIKRGIEREALRINPDGRIAQTGHPKGSGHALTNPHITTDYSEALLEFITPVSVNAEETLGQLRDLQKFTLAQMGDEMLWPMSMPCYITSQEDIGLAQFGESNIGKMKTLYRQGLKSRYGSMMQAIAGVHFNMSFSDTLWTSLAKIEGYEGPLQAFISDRYLGLIRNFKRELWLISYLFGASPSICKSFLQGRETNLPFNKVGKGTLYLEHGTALRLGNLGYTNSAQSSLKVTYNSLCDYVKGLQSAIRTKSELYSSIPDYRSEEPMQLNGNILQIENEFYSPIRPKRNTKAGETPTQALMRDGIEYIEVRALDVNPFVQEGISIEQIHFLDVFLTYCLLKDSPELEWEEQQATQRNLQCVVNEGRDQSILLDDAGNPVSLSEWATRIFADLDVVAKALDSAYQSSVYSKTIATMKDWVDDSSLTYSGRFVQMLKDKQMDGGAIAIDFAKQYKQQQLAGLYSVYSEKMLNELADTSFTKAKEIEENDEKSFKAFLQDYFEKA